jgi:hypothetical protein
MFIIAIFESSKSQEVLEPRAFKKRRNVSGAVPLPVLHAYSCTGPPQRTHGFQLDERRTVALTLDLTLGMQVQMPALFV